MKLVFKKVKLCLIKFVRYSAWAYRARAFPHMRGNDDAVEARPASKSEQILSEVWQNSAEQHQPRETAGDIRWGWLREFQRSAGIRRAAGWSRRLDQPSAALESVI